MLTRSLLLSSVAFEAKKWLRQFIEGCAWAALWNWQVTREPVATHSLHSLLYIGRRKHKSQAMVLLGLWTRNPKEALPATAQPQGRLLVSEMPFVGALCVPNHLSSVLPLDRPFEKLLENMGKDTLKFYNKQRSRYQVQPITSAEDLAHADQAMLRAYASHRYGEWAQHFDRGRLQQLARTPGGLNYVLLDGAPVACYVGSALGRGGQRYWRGERGGYSEAVYTQNKLFSEVNRMTYFLEIEQACQQGYAFYEYGLSLARPDDGVMQWKRKLRGQLDTMGNYNYFFVAPPKGLESAFFWEFPLFALELGALDLHVGLPADVADEAFASRCSTLGFGGLRTVVLHCQKPPSAHALAAVAALFAPFAHKPAIKTRLQTLL
jgi:hypothetical protein